MTRAIHLNLMCSHNSTVDLRRCTIHYFKKKKVSHINKTIYCCHIRGILYDNEVIEKGRGTRDGLETMIWPHAGAFVFDYQSNEVCRMLLV